MDTPSKTTAVLLIAHGSRRDEANADLATLAQLVAAQGHYATVAISYLELANPSIPVAAQRCVAEGATRVLMLPYFLSAGRHVTEDLQEHRRQLTEQCPGVEFHLCPPLGLHPKMVDIVLDRLREQ